MRLLWSRQRILQDDLIKCDGALEVFDGDAFIYAMEAFGIDKRCKVDNVFADGAIVSGVGGAEHDKGDGDNVVEYGGCSV